MCTFDKTFNGKCFILFVFSTTEILNYKFYNSLFCRRVLGIPKTNWIIFTYKLRHFEYLLGKTLDKKWLMSKKGAIKEKKCMICEIEI